MLSRSQSQPRTLKRIASITTSSFAAVAVSMTKRGHFKRVRSKEDERWLVAFWHQFDDLSNKKRMCSRKKELCGNTRNGYGLCSVSAEPVWKKDDPKNRCTKSQGFSALAATTCAGPCLCNHEGASVVVSCGSCFSTLWCPITSSSSHRWPSLAILVSCFFLVMSFCA